MRHSLQDEEYGEKTDKRGKRETHIKDLEYGKKH